MFSGGATGQPRRKLEVYLLLRLTLVIHPIFFVPRNKKASKSLLERPSEFAKLCPSKHDVLAAESIGIEDKQFAAKSRIESGVGSANKDR